MPHARKQIRDALVTALTGLATTGANVFSGRVEGVPQANLPALVVVTASEERVEERDTVTLADTPRTLAATVYGFALTGGDDVLDQIALEVETAIEAAPTLGGLAKWVTYQGTELLRTTEGERDHASVVLRYQVHYSTLRTSPGTAV